MRRVSVDFRHWWISCKVATDKLSVTACRLWKKGGREGEKGGREGRRKRREGRRKRREGRRREGEGEREIEKEIGRETEIYRDEKQRYIETRNRDI